MALTCFFYNRVQDFILETPERPSFNLECKDATKTKTDIQISMPAQKLYNVACLLNKLYAYNIKYQKYYMCKEELIRERERDSERAQPQ